ncbi:MAG: undecaprenyl-diphosphatase [Candidatus Pacebacteria bacterium CG10_big_fil_rev_8_21_14_0_10_42_12]|nr:MAG: undecaprenyl-diphosphatase [Candidatus Pacebacteria bacterium CG10_big_fil_rev_8_21_14_0_10_42_12]
MNIFQAVIFGIVEGISEFLPISSTFHLLLTKDALGLADSFFLNNFIVIIQSGAIFAAIALYAKKILLNRRLIINLLLSFFPTAVIGLLGHSFIKDTLFSSTTTQLVSFIGVGILFLVAEKYFGKKDQLLTSDQITTKDALLIGLAQSFAIIPGVSRSGIVLLFMLWRGYKRSSSAEYTFMLGIPTLLAASALDMLGLIQQTESITPLLMPLAVGWIVSFVVALFAMKWLVEYLKKHSLSIFGWYRIIVGLFLVLLTLL